MTHSFCSVAELCGGCPLVGLSAEESRARKLGALREALVHGLGTAFESFPIDWVSRDNATGYRHRIRLQISVNGQIGFFNREKSYDCAVLLPDLRECLHHVVEFSKRHEGLLAELCHLELRARDLDGFAGVCFYPRDPSRETAPALTPHLAELGNGWLWGIKGSRNTIPMQRHALAQLYHFVPLTSFLQVNRSINDALVLRLVEDAKARSIETFCDLYAGAGNFTLPLLAMGATGTAVEFDDLAVRACSASAAAQGLNAGIYRQGDARHHAEQLQAEGQRFDLVIIDPPRAGARDGLSAMASLAKSHLVYCSCNPASLAKDLKQLVCLGMQIESITAFDMFERTRHLETCVWLKAPTPSP